MLAPMLANTGPRGLTALAIAASIAAGILFATQHRVNGELGQRLGDGFTAALISNTIGWLILMAGLAISPHGRKGVRLLTTEVRAGRVAPWLLLGGLAGAMLVLSQGLVAGIVGVAIFSIATVTGQTISGMFADSVGFAGIRQTPVTPQRAIGALLTLLAVVTAVVPRLQTDVPLGAIVLPLLAGVATGLQQAVNGRVRTESRSALVATSLNFTVGTAVLVVVTAVHLAISGLPQVLPTSPWLYLGGALGAILIAVQVVTVTRIGVLLLGFCLVAGQLAGALLYDLVAPIGAPPTITTTAAVVLTLLGVTIASVRWRSTRPQPE